MAKTATRGVELEPLDRLEEKVRLLVSTIERLKAEHARVADANTKLQRDLDQARNQVAETETLNDELKGLRSERDVIRHRVTDMLEQLEGLNL